MTELVAGPHPCGANGLCRTGSEAASTLSGFEVQWREMYAAPSLPRKPSRASTPVARYIEGDLRSAQLDELTPRPRALEGRTCWLQGWALRASSAASSCCRESSSGRSSGSAWPRIRLGSCGNFRRVGVELLTGCPRDDRANACFADCGGRPGTPWSAFLAYCGLRPGEALALTSDAVGARRVLVESCVSLGEIKETRLAGSARCS